MMFLPHCDVPCDRLQNRCTATWNLLVKLISDFYWLIVLSCGATRAVHWTCPDTEVWNSLKLDFFGTLYVAWILFPGPAVVFHWIFFLYRLITFFQVPQTFICCNLFPFYLSFPYLFLDPNVVYLILPSYQWVTLHES